MKNNITILTALNKVDSYERQQEIVYCIEKNCSIPGVEKIIFFTENKDKTFGTYIDKAIKFYNIQIIYTKKRPTFYDLIEYANKKIDNKPVIICNSDIYFDNSISVINELDLSNKFYPLTRWMYADNGQAYLPTLFNSNNPIDKINEEDMASLNCWIECLHPGYPPDSETGESMDWSKLVGNEQKVTTESPVTYKSTGKTVTWKNEYSADAWIFQSSIFKNSLHEHESLKIPLGTFRCDTLLNYFLIKEHINNGLEARNPCLTLRCYHHDYQTTEISKSYYDDALAATDKQNHMLHRCYLPWETLNDKS